jgi:NAD(P)-dependent dehydrogenase (short-subunit alcohol dehydrogenase family)
MQNGNERTDRVWFVTGASRGFGRALSEAVLERGERLIVTARGAEFVERFGERYPNALALQLDVTDRDAVRTAIAEGVDRFGRLDVIVNNAGYGQFGAVEELTDEDVRKQFEVNVFGVLNVTRAALPHLRVQRSGHIVQMSSLNGVEGLIGGGCYCATKFAIEGLSESLAAEVAHLGIKVTIVEPGPHRTEFASSESARVADAIEDYAPTVGAARDAFAQMDGAQPGDPGRAALAIMATVDSENPPLRLPLGEMALTNIRKKLEGQLEELEAWRNLSSTTDLVVTGPS